MWILVEKGGTHAKCDMWTKNDTQAKVGTHVKIGTCDDDDISIKIVT